MRVGECKRSAKRIDYTLLLNTVYYIWRYRGNAQIFTLFRRVDFLFLFTLSSSLLRRQVPVGNFLLGPCIFSLFLVKQKSQLCFSLQHIKALEREGNLFFHRCFLPFNFHSPSLYEVVAATLHWILC